MPTLVAVAITTAGGPGPHSSALVNAAASPTRSLSLWDCEIHKAAFSHDLERCQWLVTLDPSLLEARGFNGVLPAHCAARKGALPVLRFLAQRGADLRGRDNGCWTLLHHASAGGHTHVLSALILGELLPSSSDDEAQPEPSSPSSLEVDARAGDGSTPLLVAVTEGHLEAVRFLLHCGADPGATNGKGESALSHACKFQAAMAVKADVYEPRGRLRKSKATRDREAIAALVLGSPYRVAVLRRLRQGPWGRGCCQQQQESEGEKKEEQEEGPGEVGQQQQKVMTTEGPTAVVFGVLSGLVRGCNDDVYEEALRYVGTD